MLLPKRDKVGLSIRAINNGEGDVNKWMDSLRKFSTQERTKIEGASATPSGIEIATDLRTFNFPLGLGLDFKALEIIESEDSINKLDSECRDSKTAAEANCTAQKKRCANWEEKTKDLKPGDVIMCRAISNLFHFIAGLGQIYNYSSSKFDDFRFWTHPAIVVWEEGEDYPFPGKGEDKKACDIMVAHSTGEGVILQPLGKFLCAYKYRCWAFRPADLKGNDVGQIKQAVIGYTHYFPELSRIDGNARRKLQSYQYDVLVLLSILLAHLFGHLRLRFSIARQFTCAGLVAELLERGGYRFTEGEENAFPADVARRVMHKQPYFWVSPPSPDSDASWPKKFKRLLGGHREDRHPFCRRGFHDGITSLFQQLREDLPSVFCKVLGALALSLFICMFIFYVGWAVGTGVSPNLAGAIRPGTGAFWGATAGAILASLVSTRIFPNYSRVLIPLGLVVDLWFFLPSDCDLLQVPPLPSFLFALCATMALAVGTAAMLFSALMQCKLMWRLLYPFAYWVGWRRKIN